MTLIEVLISIAIVAGIIAILLPAVQLSRESARRMSCANNLRQLGLALLAYSSTHDAFPAVSTSTVLFRRERVGNLSFLVRILPHLEESALFEQVRWDQPYDSGYHLLALSNASVKCSQCPSCPVARAQLGEGRTSHYFGVLGPKGPDYRIEMPAMGANGGRATDGVLQVDIWQRLASVTDGTSNTFLLGELSWKNSGVLRPWTRGAEIAAANPGKNVAYGIRVHKYGGNDFNDVSFGSEHGSVCNFLMCDGSLSAFSNSTSLAVMQLLASKGGGEINP